MNVAKMPDIEWVPFAIGGCHREIVEDFWRKAEPDSRAVPTGILWDIGERLAFAQGYGLGRGLSPEAAGCFSRFVVCNYVCSVAETGAKATLMAITKAGVPDGHK